MTSNQQGYATRYQKIKSNKMRSVSPSHYEHNTDQSPSRPTIHHSYNNAQTQLGKVVAQLADRVDGIEVKMVSITNIVKLLQKYTETKDIQYEKQKQNEEYRRNIGDKMPNLQYLQMQTKINEIQAITQRAKAQITAMEGLRISIQRQNSRKIISSPQPHQTLPRTFQTTSPNNTKQIMEDIQDIMDRVQTSLREQMNKKIDICMNFFKNATQQLRMPRASSPTTVNAIMMQEQLHNMTLTMNKVQSDCNRNKMLTQNKIEQIINYVRNLKKKQGQSSSEKQINRSGSRTANRLSRNDGESVHSQHSSISKKSKKSKSKSNKSKSKSITKSQKAVSDRRIQDNHKISIFNKIQQQKKQKQTQLKQALRRKKQNQQKLKMKR